MKMRNVFLLAIAMGVLTILVQSSFAQEPIKFETDPPQRIDVPFRLFKTQNIWTYLLLDTRNGRIWQVNYSIDSNVASVKIPINDTALVAGEKEVGRFTLYPTHNMWTFLLLDQETGNVWQCQFSIDDNHRFIFPIYSIRSPAEEASRIEPWRKENVEQPKDIFDEISSTGKKDSNDLELKKKSVRFSPIKDSNDPELKTKKVRLIPDNP